MVTDEEWFQPIIDADRLIFRDLTQGSEYVTLFDHFVMLPVNVVCFPLFGIFFTLFRIYHKK
jgi:hypothetical protein